MIHIQVSEWIAQPAAKVFGYITDPRKVAEYTQIPTETTRIAVDPGENPRAHVTARGWGRLTMSAAQEITEYLPGRRVALTTVEDHGWLVAFTQWDLTPEEGGTRVAVRHAIQPYGWLRVLAPLLTSLVRETVEDEMARLKEEVETSSSTAEGK